MFDRLVGVVGRARRTGGSARSDELPRVQAAPSKRLVDVVVYADDCILSARVQLTADRLSDMLNDTEIVDLTNVLVEALQDENPFEVRDLQVSREEILLVHAGGPRGDPGRRHRTRQHPIVAKAGPYVVRGYLHSLPGTDAIASLRRRKPMIALTDAVIEYTIRSNPHQRRAGVLILNQEGTDWVVEGHEAEVVMPELPVDTTGSLLKDFTGEIFELDADWNA
jgi:hypothetical protein